MLMNKELNALDRLVNGNDETSKAFRAKAPQTAKYLKEVMIPLERKAQEGWKRLQKENKNN